MRPPRFSRAIALLALALIIAGVLSACGGSTEAAAQPPASVEKSAVAGQPSRLFLTLQAVQKIGIQTVAVETLSSTATSSTTSTFSTATSSPTTTTASTVASGAAQKLVIPYSAVVYDPTGQAWVFTNPQPLQFVRAPITIDQIQGDTAILSSGPAVGTLIVTVGAEELLGTEHGVGHE